MAVVRSSFISFAKNRRRHTVHPLLLPRSTCRDKMLLKATSSSYSYPSPVPAVMLYLLSSFVHPITCDIAFGGDNAEELTLAIVNITSMEPFTGFASNFRDDSGAKFTSFGSSKIGTISGLLVKVLTGEKKVNDACESIDETQWASEPWILVAQHGNCKDEQKMRNIVRTNASAALIYDNKPNPRLVKLKCKYLLDTLFSCLFWPWSRLLSVNLWTLEVANPNWWVHLPVTFLCAVMPFTFRPSSSLLIFFSCSHRLHHL